MITVSFAFPLVCLTGEWWLGDIGQTTSLGFYEDCVISAVGYFSSMWNKGISFQEDSSRYKMPVLGQEERGASIDLTWRPVLGQEERGAERPLRLFLS
ncbi:hypothetical protein NPIL_526971 [Nephila pilipes]|uniref:Uncharacterized protein n=1 Tax=Nephila pilipes TaxID=299642 RepID=A0A8X6URQ4_NEPPI|nr:hypothetical protein NPIL_526971 [Nephila pilipes]